MFYKWFATFAELLFGLVGCVLIKVQKNSTKREREKGYECYLFSRGPNKED